MILKKIAGLGIKSAILSKTAIFAISKKQIIWHKTIELFMVNYQIWYDLDDWFKCFYNFRSGSLAMGHTVYYIFGVRRILLGGIAVVVPILYIMS